MAEDRIGRIFGITQIGNEAFDFFKRDEISNACIIKGKFFIGMPRNEATNATARFTDCCCPLGTGWFAFGKEIIVFKSFMPLLLALLGPLLDGDVMDLEEGKIRHCYLPHHRKSPS